MSDQKENQGKKPGFIFCVCTGKCPGFAKMDMWDFVNMVRMQLPVEYAFIHPQLCEVDGDRFFDEHLRGGRKYFIAGCAPAMQYKLFRDAFTKAGLNVQKDLIPLDVRNMTTQEAFETVKKKLEEWGFTADE